MRKYIFMAKSVKPQLTEAASAYISERYAELRSFDTSKGDRERTMPVTARQLETMIRLSTAMAKARLAKTIEKSDAEKAFQLLYFACFKEKPKQRLDGEPKIQPVVGDESDEEMDTDSLPISTQSTRASRAAKRRGGGTDDIPDSLDTEVDSQISEPAAKKVRAEETPAISVDRYLCVFVIQDQLIFNFFQTQNFP